MELNITEKKEDQLADRTVVTAKLSFTGATPSNNQVKDSIASKMKTKPENVVVKQIKTTYGYTEANVTANVYNSTESIKIYEPKPGKKYIEKQEKAREEAKKKAEEDKKKAEEEAKAAAETEKAEEKKEEAPAEEKTDDKPATEEPSEEKPAEPEEKKEEAPTEEKKE